MEIRVPGALRRACAVALVVLAGPGAAGASAAISVQDVAVEEGRPAAFLVRTDLVTGAESVVISTAEGTASDPEDYTGIEQQVEIASGPGTVVTVPTISETTPEADEHFELLVDPVGPGDTRRAKGTVRNDDPPPLLAVVRDARENAGGQSVAVGLLLPTTRTVTVKLATADGSAQAGADFAATSATVQFAPGEQVKEVVVPLADDGVYEGDEGYEVRLSDAVNAVLVGASAPATLREDEPLPTVSLEGGGPVAEGDTGDTPVPFRLRLSGPAAVPIPVAAVSERGTATSPADFVALQEVVLFAPGETEKAVALRVKGDTTFEPDERLRVLAGPLVNARTPDGGPLAAVVTIRNDDRDTDPPAARLTAPRLRGGALTVRLSCPAGEERCSGRVTFFKNADRRAADRRVRREVRLGATSFALAGGRAADVRLRLGAAARRVLRRARRARISAYALVGDTAGNRVTVRRTSTVRGSGRGAHGAGSRSYP